MAIQYRIVQGVMVYPKSGEPIQNGKIRFYLNKGFGLTSTHLISDAPRIVTTAADGSFSIPLWCDETGLRPIDYIVNVPKESGGEPLTDPEHTGTFSLVPGDGTPIDLPVLLIASSPNPTPVDPLYQLIDARIAAIGTGGAVDATIIDGSVKAVSGNAVFDALALKANNNAVVNLTTAQTIAGLKIFTENIVIPTDTYDEGLWKGVKELEAASKGAMAGQFQVVDVNLALKADKVAGIVPAAQLPDFILKFATVAAFPVTGDVRKIYIVTTDADINKVYQWSGTAYVQLAPAAAAGGGTGGTGGFSTLTKTVAYAILGSDSYTNFNNTGATALVSLNLPAAANDLNYSFTVTDADGMQINFTNGSTGYDGAVAATFYLRSVVIGSTLTIRGQGANWYVTSRTGTWTIA